MIIKVIGLGGIGSHIMSPLCRYIEALRVQQKPQVVVIDGDSYEMKNANRQEFLDVGNKAEVTAERMKRDFPDISIEAKPQYVAEENIFFMINSGDVVLLGVDNHATRKLVSDHCVTLDEIVLISGGNELTDGNVQIYIRSKGKNLTPPLVYLHPEIDNPVDKNPSEMSCEELAKSSVPQLIFTNLSVAILMLNAFWMVIEFLTGRGKLVYSEQYFDIATGMTRSVFHKPVL